MTGNTSRAGPAQTVVKGLASGRTCLLRSRVIPKKGPTDWSQPLECMVP